MMAIRIPGPTTPALWKCLTTPTPHTTEITNIRQIHTTLIHGTLIKKLDHITVHTRRCHKFHLVPPIIPGLEDFEGKIEKIAGGVDKDENSWLNKLYKQYHGESLAETLEGDTLAEENEDEMALSNDEHESVENRAFRKKRSDEEVVKKEEEDIEAIFNSVESSCSTKFWRCVSNVIEGGLHYTEMPGGLTGAMKKHLMKVVFAGGISNMWDSLMTVPEARKFQKCMAKQTECTEYEILQKALNSEKALPQRVLVVPESIKVEEEPEE